eukprot:gene2989-3446_t
MERRPFLNYSMLDKYIGKHASIIGKVSGLSEEIQGIVAVTGKVEGSNSFTADQVFSLGSEDMGGGAIFWSLLHCILSWLGLHANSTLSLLRPRTYLTTLSSRFTERYNDMQSLSEKMSAAKRLVDFINRAPSPFHVVQVCRERLLASGFKELNEKQLWNNINEEKQRKFFVVRNNSTIVAFAVGNKYTAGNGFNVIAAHTDSPCLKVKPKSKKESSGYLSVGVECYGGGIWNTWFDRDLKVAGRVIIKTETGFKEELVHVDRPILRVPHLAIHLQRDVNDSFGPNKERHILPVLAMSPSKSLLVQDNSVSKDSQFSSHHSHLIDAVCNELQCDVANLYDMELYLADAQNATIGGVLNEFIFAPRLDNLFNVFTGLEALIESLEDDSLEESSTIRMLACYDNEEVGSESAQGAGSQITLLIMKRILSAFGHDNTLETVLANSFVVSADQVHAVHPNYSEKHEDNHKPDLNKGPVIKFNSNQRYATTSLTACIVRAIAEKAGVELQSIVVRNDSPCGSTIGPILSAKLGVRTVDIGCPMLSMHSIREMCGTASVQQAISLYKVFYEKFQEIDASFQ